MRSSLVGLVGVLFSMCALSATAQEAVRIGVVLPLSGPNAQFGQNSKNGMEQAVADINAAGGIRELGGAKVELVLADVPQPGAAAAATQRLISQDKVVGIVGAFASSITLAASEVSERSGVPFITHSFADQITGRGYKSVFQVSPKASTFGQAQFDQAVEIAARAGVKIGRVAILFEDTAYGTAQAQGIRTAAAKAGVSVVLDEGYPLGVTDVAPLVNKIRATRPDIVFPVSYLNDGLLLIRAMRQQKLDLPIIGGAAGYVIPEFHRSLGEFSEGVLSVAPANYDAIPDIANRYRSKYGTFMPHEAIMYGAAVQHLVSAISTARSLDHAKVREAVATTRKCDGFAAGIPGGCIAFDANGLNAAAFPIFVQWRGGELVTVHPQKVAKARPRWAGKEVGE